MNRTTSGKAPRDIVAKMAKRAKSRIRKRETGKSPPAKQRAKRVHKSESVPLEGRLAYSPSEFARLIGRSRVTIWRRIHDGKINTVDVLGATMIPASELQRLGLSS